MITELSNSITREYGKKNWMDQNNVVFGYQDYQDCCESWGWGVFNPQTKERICDDPNGLPYHFDLEHGVIEMSFNDFPPDKDRPETMLEQKKGDYLEVFDVVRVRLLSDSGDDPDLIFEAYTDHNGYYLHDFSFGKV